MKLRNLRLILALVAVGLAPSANASIIGPTNDWVGLREGAKKWGISVDMVDEILAAGLNLYCDGKKHHNPQTLNAWLIQADETTIVTNAHAFRDEAQRDRGECYVQSLADIMDSLEHPNPIPKAYVDLSTIVLGTEHPYSDNFRTDRAKAELRSTLMSSAPLTLPAVLPVVSAGDEIFVVSRRPHWMRSDIRTRFQKPTSTLRLSG